MGVGRRSHKTRKGRDGQGGKTGTRKENRGIGNLTMVHRSPCLVGISVLVLVGQCAARPSLETNLPLLLY